MRTGVCACRMACMWAEWRASGAALARAVAVVRVKKIRLAVYTHTYTRTCTHTHTHTAALPDCMRVFPQRLLAHYFLERLKNGGRNDGFYDPEKDPVGFLLVQVMMIMIMIVQ